jgi:hypothetical protein
MKKQTRSYRKYLPYLAIVALVLSSLACNLANVIQNEGYEEPRYREEEHFDEGEPRPEDEEHFEEEEPFHEEDPNFEEHHEEGEHHHEEDPDFDEHHEEGEPHHEEDEHFEDEHHEEGEPHNEEEHHEEECPPESECAGGPGSDQGGEWTTDVAVTDIYPGNQPHGQFHVRITNHGPGTLDNIQVDLLCGFDSMDKNTGKVGPSDQVKFTVSLGMRPSETQSFPTGLDLDTNVYEYGVGCEVIPGFNDPDQGNNFYHEVVK